MVIRCLKCIVIKCIYKSTTSVWKVLKRNMSILKSILKSFFVKIT